MKPPPTATSCRCDAVKLARRPILTSTHAGETHLPPLPVARYLLQPSQFTLHRRAISFALEIGLQNVVYEGDSNAVISYLKELRLALLVWHLLVMLLRIPTFWLCRSVLVLCSMYVERVMLWLIN
ncbi:hypothetical protein SO802_003110 [Lithocarpus litseifolius]|uniref:RNase H type-1 domain-containing protein n=1 Tax=Lithocarpus litseifolius TaxID=425828 RepID=A0AAW2E4W4_9ROSI